jgi:hypothetical protein
MSLNTTRHFQICCSKWRLIQSFANDAVALPQQCCWKYVTNETNRRHKNGIQTNLLTFRHILWMRAFVALMLSYHLGGQVLPSPPPRPTRNYKVYIIHPYRRKGILWSNWKHITRTRHAKVQGFQLNCACITIPNTTHAYKRCWAGTTPSAYGWMIDEKCGSTTSTDLLPMRSSFFQRSPRHKHYLSSEAKRQYLRPNTDLSQLTFTESCLCTGTILRFTYAVETRNCSTLGLCGNSASRNSNYQICLLTFTNHVWNSHRISYS